MKLDFFELSLFFQQFKMPVVIVDLETTGGNFETDRITEIALLHFWQSKITPMQQLINPTIPISEFVQNLTGISDEMVADAPIFADYAPKILPYLRGSLLIAHNSKFDYSFLRQEFARMGIAFASHTLCSVQLSRKLYPQFYRHSLDAIIDRHTIELDGDRHRAMSDVLALAQFLQLAVRENGATFQAAKNLCQPALLPEKLSDTLRQKFADLPDSDGVSLWRNAAQNVIALHTHKRAFHEIATLFRQPKYVHSADFEFFPTIGALHSIAVKAQILQRENIRPNDEILRHTIVLQNFSGCLKARIRPLNAGFHTDSPHGLFLHPKAAKRALQDWAAQFNLCPTLLGILPHELPKNAPCPVSLVGRCSEACRTGNIAAHNVAVLAALPFLPIVNWGNTPRITLSEYNPISKEKQEFIFDTGALMLSENHWYVDEELLSILKQKFSGSQKRHSR